MTEKLFLIDGTALVYRSYFAFIKNPLINTKGQNTSAIYGIISSFIKLIERYSPRHIAISFDRKEPTFRHELSIDYKANRPPMPPDMISQLEPIKEFFKLIGVKEFSCPGYEADDVLATLAEKFRDKYEVIIVSGDKDFCQLVNDSVMLYDPFKETTTLKDDVIVKYGLKPEYFVDYLALTGDSADNIPGVSGIGPKKAEELLSKYETIESLYENIEDIASESIRQKLLNNKENAFLSKTLATINRNVPLEMKPDEGFTFQAANLGNSLDFVKEYELNSLYKKIDTSFKVKELISADGNADEDFFSYFGEKSTSVENVVEKEKRIPFKSTLINNENDFSALIDKMKNVDVIAFDTETTSIDPLIARIVGISLCFNDQEAYYLSLNHSLADNLEADKVLPIIETALTEKLIVGHNIKYDMLVMDKYGWNFDNQLFDTMIASYLLDPASMRHSLDKCAEEYLGHKMIPIEDVIGKGKSEITFDLADQRKACDYSSEDAYITFRLYTLFLEKLKSAKLYKLFEDMEMPLMRVLADIEKNGVYISEKSLRETSKIINKKISELTRQIYQLTGKTFNLNSTQQLAQILFEEMGIPSVKKTKTGYSTDNLVLESLADDYEIARLLIEYRQASKLESTYTSSLPKLINNTTGRIHSSFNQTVASTGRLSSSNPNLQNIPVRSELGREIRKAFTVPSEDFLLVSADYSQIELRLLAIMSGDPNLIAAFRNNKDIHRETAAIIFNIPEEKITSDERRKAKVINFGIIYGMGSVKLSKELTISRNDAKEFIDNYFEKFPTVRNYMNKQVLFAREHGYVSTLYGRKLLLPLINSSNKGLSSAAERVAVNMPIQGSAADIIKIAMIRINNVIKGDENIRMLIQVHDELVFEVRKDYLPEAENLIKIEMEKALDEQYSKMVAMKVDIGHGKNWYEAHN